MYRLYRLWEYKTADKASWMMQVDGRYDQVAAAFLPGDMEAALQSASQR